MKALVLAAIRFYQRRLSPHKGFGCAYRIYSGCASCSALGLRAVRRHGVRRGLGILDGRLRRCGIAHRRQHAAARMRPGQAGFCDVVACDLPCDSAGCDCASSACDCAYCVDLPCGGRKARYGGEREDEGVVYIPRASGARRQGAPSTTQVV